MFLFLCFFFLFVSSYTHLTFIKNSSKLINLHLDPPPSRIHARHVLHSHPRRLVPRVLRFHFYYKSKPRSGACDGSFIIAYKVISSSLILFNLMLAFYLRFYIFYYSSYVTLVTPLITFILKRMVDLFFFLLCVLAFTMI